MTLICVDTNYKLDAHLSEYVVVSSIYIYIYIDMSVLLQIALSRAVLSLIDAFSKSLSNNEFMKDIHFEVLRNFSFH